MSTVGESCLRCTGMANRFFFFHDLATPILPETSGTSVGGGKAGGLDVEKKENTHYSWIPASQVKVASR